MNLINLHFHNIEPKIRKKKTTLLCQNRSSQIEGRGLNGLRWSGLSSFCAFESVCRSISHIFLSRYNQLSPHIETLPIQHEGISFASKIFLDSVQMLIEAVSSLAKRNDMNVKKSKKVLGISKKYSVLLLRPELTKRRLS